MKGLKALAKVVRKYFIHNMDKEITAIEKELKALNVIQKYYFGADIIHDLYCLGASDEEIALVKECIK